MASGRAPFVAVRTDVRKEERILVVADLGGYNRHEALGRLVDLWCWCADRKLEDAPEDCDGYAVPEAVIRRFLGPRGVEAILGDGCDELAMGARRPDGLIYLRGTSDTVDRLRSLRTVARSGGRSREDNAPRDSSGRFVGSTTLVQLTDQPATSRPPAAASEIPDPRSQIPDPEDRNSLPRAIPALVPEPPATPPVPPAIDLSVPPGESAWHRRLRWWGAMLEADQRLRAAGIEPNAPALPKAPAGANETNMNRCERQLLDGGAEPGEVDAKMRHIVFVAEAEALRERHRRWFKPALIWDPERAARAADTSLDEAKRSRDVPPKRDRNGRAEPPSMPVPPKFKPEPPLVDRADPEDARKAVRELATLLGEARAPPRAANGTDEGQNPQPKAAT